jgi:toxin ParE1/3/4
MARVLRTESAKSDILAIYGHIATDKPSAADRWVGEVDSTLSVISHQPFLGEKVDHLATGMRRHCLGSYLLFYVPIDGGIELRRVLHGARKIEEFF